MTSPAGVSRKYIYQPLNELVTAENSTTHSLYYIRIIIISAMGGSRSPDFLTVGDAPLCDAGLSACLSARMTPTANLLGDPTGTEAVSPGDHFYTQLTP